MKSLWGFQVVRLPGRSSSNDLGRINCLNDLWYCGVERLPWDVVRRDFWTRELPGDVHAAYLRIYREGRTRYCEPLASLDDARLVLDFSDRRFRGHEIIGVAGMEAGGDLLEEAARNGVELRFLGFDVIAAGEWSLLKSGVFEAPQHLADWVGRLNLHGLLDEVSEGLVSGLVHDYARAAEVRAVEDLAKHPLAVPLGVWRLRFGDAWPGMVEAPGAGGLYRVGRDRDDWEGRYELSGRHRWRLPGLLACSECGRTKDTFFMNYPSLDMSRVHQPDLDRLEIAPQWAWRDWTSLAQYLGRLLPPGAILRPGSEFGPLAGKARGRFGDFAWVGSALPLLRREAYDALSARGVRMPAGVPPDLRFPPRGQTVDFLELELLPLLRLGESSFRTLEDGESIFCPSCGRPAGVRLESLEALAYSVPQDVDLFRGEDAEHLIFATERFVKAARDLGLRDITFHEIPLV